MNLAGLAPVETYQEAAAVLESAYLRRDGIPMGGTWRTAAKMSDAELMAAIGVTFEAHEGPDRY